MFIKKCLVVALSTVLAASFVISQETAVANVSQAATTTGTTTIGTGTTGTTTTGTSSTGTTGA
jgi:hypothetical protein